MQTIMKGLMLSCQKATELMEKQLLTRLSPFEKMKLVLHTKMCDACTVYQKQTALIQKALDRSSSHDVPSPDVSSFKEKVKAQICD
jgi:hypothetical protein